MTKPEKKAPDQPDQNKKSRKKRRPAPEILLKTGQDAVSDAASDSDAETAYPNPGSKSDDSSSPNIGQNFVYILLCSDGTLYTGWTNNIDRRLEAHNSGKGAKYTRTRRPVKLAHLEVFTTKEEAMKREAAIKRLTRARKIALIEENGDIKSE